MSLLLRKTQLLLLSPLRPRIRSVEDEHSIQFRVLPTDLDENIHMNHARFLSYMEAARWDMQICSGFLTKALKHRWYVPIANIDIRYHRPLRPWQKFTVHTKLSHWDETWVYFSHRIVSRNKLCASALITSTIRKNRNVIHPEQAFEIVGLQWTPKSPLKKTA